MSRMAGNCATAWQRAPGEHKHKKRNRADKFSKPHGIACNIPVLRGQGAALYGPRACDKNMMTASTAIVG